MAILRGESSEWYYPKPSGEDRCMLCCGPLYYPVLQWAPHFRADDDDPCHERGVRFLCKECCAEIHHGFIRDLKEMKQIRELRRLGFHGARPTTDGEVFVPPEGEHAN